jgi:hypothetical protein
MVSIRFGVSDQFNDGRHQSNLFLIRLPGRRPLRPKAEGKPRRTQRRVERIWRGKAESRKSFSVHEILEKREHRKDQRI